MCRGRYFNSSSQLLTRPAIFDSSRILDACGFRRALMFGSTPPHQATLFGPGSFAKVATYSPYFRLSADLDYFLRLSDFQDLSVHCLDLELVYISEGGVSGQQTLRRLKEVRRAYINAFGFLWFCIHNALFRAFGNCDAMEPLMQLHLFGSATPTGEFFCQQAPRCYPDWPLYPYSRRSSNSYVDFTSPNSFHPVGDPSAPGLWISFAPIWLFSTFLEYLSTRTPERLAGLRGVIACSSSSVITKRFAISTFDRELVARLALAEEQLLSTWSPRRALHDSSANTYLRQSRSL